MRRLYALLFGVLALFVVLEVVLGVASRSFLASQLADNRADLAEGQVRILCIGESTTAVAGNPDNSMLVRDHSYPAKLEARLDARQDGRDYRVLNLGIMGGTSESILELLPAALDEFQPHIIISMMGIKDGSARGSGFALPRWLRERNTVKLLDWLVEDRRLRRDAIALDVETAADVPDSMGGHVGRVRIHAMESRLALESTPQTQRARDAIEVGIYYWYIGRLQKAEAVLQASVDEVGMGHSVLAWVLVTAGREDEAVTLLQDAIAAHPEEGLYRVVLADILSQLGRLEEAEAVVFDGFSALSVVRMADYTSVRLQIVQAQIDRLQGDPRRAIQRLSQLRPARLSGQHSQFLAGPMLLIQLGLAAANMDLERWHQAEMHLQRVINIHPSRHTSMFMLSQVYRAQGKFKEEEETRRSLLAHEGRMAEYFELARMFQLSGADEQVEPLLTAAVQRIPTLRSSHDALYGIAQRQGAHLIVMQYPSFSLDLLHTYAPPDPAVSFVDNEHIFDADPDAYWFEPRFPHSFSHYTHDGAELLAERAAETVVAVTEDMGL